MQYNNSTAQLDAGQLFDQSDNTLHIEIKSVSPEFQRQYSELSALLSKNHLKLKRFIRKHFIGVDIVDDLTQQTCLEAFRNWENFRGDSKPETWLFGIAFNLIRNARVNHYRVQQTFEPLDEIHYDVVYDASDEPEEAALQREKMHLLASTINELPKKMQAVVGLVFIEGKSYQEVSDELGLPIGTIRSRLSRARELIKEKLID